MSGAATEEYTMTIAQKHDGLIQNIQDNFGERIVALRRDIHREPELGFGTEKTAEKSWPPSMVCRWTYRPASPRTG